MPAGFRAAISSFKDAELSEAEKQHQANFPFVKQAYELSLELSRGLSEAATATQQLAAFETILEKCRIFWGSRPALVAAEIHCVSQRRIRPSVAPFDFFARQVSTTQRLRAAKARKGQCDWWLQSLEKSKSEPKSLRLLLIEALLLLCPTDTVARCETQLAEVLDGMTDEEWTSLAQTVATLNGVVRRSENKEEALAEAGFKFDAVRCSYLIALREPDRFGKSVFLKFFRGYSGTAPMYLEFRQVQALKCAIAGSLHWNEALETVRDGYARGVHATELDYHLRNSAMEIPQEVYSQVLSNPQIYPVTLCDTAEAAGSRAARKAVKPVSTIAKSERWFAFDK